MTFPNTAATEPHRNATDFVGLSQRINWLQDQIMGIDAQLGDRAAYRDPTWRRRTIAAKQYRLAELRDLKLRRSQLAPNRERAMLRRAADIFTEWSEHGDMTDEENSLWLSIEEYLG